MMFRATCSCGREIQINHTPPETYWCGTAVLGILSKIGTGEFTGGCGESTPGSEFVEDGGEKVWHSALPEQVGSDDA